MNDNTNTTPTPTGRSKTVEINGQKFKIDAIAAQPGSWILAMSMGGRLAEFDVFTRAQGYAFGSCWRLDSMTDGKEMPRRVYDQAQAKWLLPELASDVNTVNELWLEALDFNIGPTLAKAEARIAEAKKKREASGTGPFDSPNTSPDTSGVQS